MPRFVRCRFALPFLLVCAGCRFPLADDADGTCQLVDYRVLAEAPQEPAAERLRVPADLPGADVPPLDVPPLDAGAKAERERILARLFPPLPPLEPLPVAEGKPLELADLQSIALANSPHYRQAEADIEAARGAAVQAGLPPNPAVGIFANDVGQGNTAGAFGALLEQTIKTGGKLKVARAAALVEVANAEVARRRTQVDVLTQVRQGYFAVLTAQEALRLAHGVARFTEELYRLQVEQLRGAQVAAYEPLQFRAQAVQARGLVAQTRNRHAAAWRRLAAALGTPGAPPAPLAGRADGPVPTFDHDAVAALVLARHTDVQMAENEVARAHLRLRLAQITPIPDVTFNVAVAARDYTNTPALPTASVEVSVPLPTWDRNQGAIRQAAAQLDRAAEGARRARNDLAARLADAYQRYDSSRRLVELYRASVLPDQVQVFRNVYERYNVQPGVVNFNDVAGAQQNYAATLSAYATALGDQWSAVVEIAELLQTDDLFHADGADGGLSDKPRSHDARR